VTVEIRAADPRQEVFARFLAAGDAFAASLYPAESNHMLDVATLLAPTVRFFGIWRDDAAAGCGGFQMQDGYVEIKRVWIDPRHRGRGLSRLLMLRLEDEARLLGFRMARLETGIHQPEALGLYRALGYSTCPPFGAYGPDPVSVFMEKPL
jgi:putative acetyltransferase